MEVVGARVESPSHEITQELLVPEKFLYWCIAYSPAADCRTRVLLDVATSVTSAAE